MGRDGYISGVYTGDRHFTGNISFAQGAAGASFNFVKEGTQIWYVDSGKSTGVSGDGLTWEHAFMTLKEAVTKAGDDDTILVAPGTIQTIATGGINITQSRLKIFGTNGSSNRQAAALKMVAGTTPMFVIEGDGVEIAGFNLSCRVAYPVICIGNVASGVGTAFYSVWIHHNNIDGEGTGTFGVAMGGAGGFGVATQCDAVNLTIEDNVFSQLVTACVVVSGTRMSVLNNEFNVIANSIGISVVETGGNRGYWTVNGNRLTGIAGGSTVGIKFAGNTTAGSGTVMQNLLAGTWDTVISNNTGIVGCENYEASTTGGSVIDFDGA